MMSRPTVAVIQFPGSNCEYEAQRAAQYYGFDAQIVRWNEPVDHVRHFDAYILPGGFSYQDRVRAGAIAAKLPVLKTISEAVDAGKSVLGICNGCQILAESGLVTEMAMAPNARDGVPVGFICNWQYVRVTNPEASLFTRYFTADDVLPVPINHGEGRFVLSDSAQASLPQMATFRYCDDQGEIRTEFPINPNGASFNLAGISSSKGNVFAIMPHPERAAQLKQIPVSNRGAWQVKKLGLLNGDHDGPGPWEKLFVGMVDYARARQ
jgi:phosphoribosylformylglycinamidine synthase